MIKVHTVDDGLLKFRNLEELTLSVNKLRAVDTRNIPSTLKVMGSMVGGLFLLMDLKALDPFRYY